MKKKKNISIKYILFFKKKMIISNKHSKEENNEIEMNIAEVRIIFF